MGCTGTGDYILRMSKTPGTAPVASMCATFAPETGIKCGFTTPEAQLAEIDKMAAGIGQPCTVKGRRYIGSTPDHTDFFEVACSEGKGYVLQTGANGALQQSIDCVKATELAGGCTLTDVRQQQTELVGVYTHLAQKAGFDCTVSKYAEFPAKADGTEVVELACSNRPDGGVGLFPANGTPKVLDCLRASAQGYVCNMTKGPDPGLRQADGVAEGLQGQLRVQDRQRASAGLHGLGRPDRSRLRRPAGRGGRDLERHQFGHRHPLVQRVDDHRRRRLPAARQQEVITAARAGLL